MAPYAVHITLRTNFHGKAEEFDLVFHYNTGPSPTEAGWIDLMNAIRTDLQSQYGAETTFVRGRVHGPSDAPNEEDRQMRAAVDFPLNTVGTKNTGTALAPELAPIIEWDLGRSSRGYRQILKKFLRGCRLPTTDVNILQGRTELDTTSKNELTGLGNSLKQKTIGAVVNNICNPSGKVFPAASLATTAKYVHSRQMRRGRKRTVNPSP